MASDAAAGQEAELVLHQEIRGVQSGHGKGLALEAEGNHVEALGHARRNQPEDPRRDVDEDSVRRRAGAEDLADSPEERILGDPAAQ